MGPKFHKLPRGFSAGTKIPKAVIFRRSTSGIYAMDSVNDKDEEGKNVLSFLVGLPLNRCKMFDSIHFGIGNYA
jgi:hypothetical protein